MIAAIAPSLRFVLVGGEKLDLAGEAVTIGVEAGAVLPFFGSRPRRFLRVSVVGVELRAGCHVCFTFRSSSPNGAAPLTKI
jgi:hypothetical protein